MIEVEEQSAETLPIPPEETRQQGGFLRAALLLSIGNIVSRLLGLVRETVKAGLFGRSGALSAFEIAVFVPMSIFQLVIGGEMVNSALVPIFSEYAASEKRRDLWEVVSIFLSLVIFILAICVGAIMLFAPTIVSLLAGQFEDPTLQPLAIRWVRLATPAILFLSVASFISGVLYALKRFTAPAFVTATLNLSFIICAYIWGNEEGLVWGLLIGSVLQVIVQLPALRDAKLRWSFNWRHPAIRRISLLYMPIVLGLVVNRVSEGASYRLATGFGDSNVSAMRFATTLYQFPQGLVATALAIAILPTLSHLALGAVGQFKETLAGGLRLVLGLILPAAFGLFALAIPITSLLFERGAFGPEDTAFVSLMLRYYLIGLPFAAIDLMLVSASYARQRTWEPALVGVISLGFYWAAALMLLDTMGIFALMIADAVKQISHVGMMLFVLRRQVGRIVGFGVVNTAGKALFGSVLTALGAWGSAEMLTPILTPNSFIEKTILVTISGVIGLAIYLLCVSLLDIREVKNVLRDIRRRQHINRIDVFITHSTSVSKK